MIAERIRTLERSLRECQEARRVAAACRKQNARLSARLMAFAGHNQRLEAALSSAAARAQGAEARCQQLELQVKQLSSEAQYAEVRSISSASAVYLTHVCSHLCHLPPWLASSSQALARSADRELQSVRSVTAKLAREQRYRDVYDRMRGLKQAARRHLGLLQMDLQSGDIDRSGGDSRIHLKSNAPAGSETSNRVSKCLIRCGVAYAELIRRASALALSASCAANTSPPSGVPLESHACVIGLAPGCSSACDR